MGKFRELFEGNWAQPKTTKQAKELVKLLKKPMFKKDSDKLYDLVGDDDFLDALDDVFRDGEEDQDIRGFVKDWVNDNWLDKLDSNGWSKDWDPKAIKYLEKNL